MLELDNPSTRTQGSSRSNYTQDITETVILRTQLIIQNNMVDSFEAYKVNILEELTSHYGNCNWSITKPANMHNTITIRGHIPGNNFSLSVYVPIPNEIANLPSDLEGTYETEQSPAPLLGGERVFPPTYELSENLRIAQERMERLQREVEISSRQMREAIERQQPEEQESAVLDEVQTAHDYLHRHPWESIHDVVSARPATQEMSIIGQARQSGRLLTTAPRSINNLLDVQEALSAPGVQPVPVSERTIHELLEEIHISPYGREPAGMNPSSDIQRSTSFDLENIARALNEPNNKTADIPPLRTEGEPRSLASVARVVAHEYMTRRDDDLVEALSEMYEDVQRRAANQTRDPEALENRVPRPGVSEDTRYTDQLIVREDAGFFVMGDPVPRTNLNRRVYSLDQLSQILGSPHTPAFQPIAAPVSVEIDTEVSSPLDLSDGYFPTINLQVRRER